MSLELVQNTDEQNSKALMLSANPGLCPFEDSFSIEFLSALLEEYLLNLEKKSRTYNTLTAYRTDLSLFCDFLVTHKVSIENYSPSDHDQFVRFLRLNGRNSQSGIRRLQMSIRGFIHFLISSGSIVRSSFLEIKSPQQPCNRILTVPPEKYGFLCHKLEKKIRSGDKKAVRDLALFRVLGECGLKVSEVSNLCWGDLWTGMDEPKSQDDFAGCLHITGTHERLVPYSLSLFHALENLKSARVSLGLGVNPHDKIFFGYLNVSRRLAGDGLHRHGIKFIVYEICSEYLSTMYNPESLRNHAIFNWLSSGIHQDRILDYAGYSSQGSLARFLSPNLGKSISVHVRQDNVLLQEPVFQENEA